MKIESGYYKLLNAFGNFFIAECQTKMTVKLLELGGKD
jgi:hypothetical protein